MISQKLKVTNNDKFKLQMHTICDIRLVETQLVCGMNIFILYVQTCCTWGNILSYNVMTMYPYKTSFYYYHKGEKIDQKTKFCTVQNQIKKCFFYIYIYGPCSFE